MYAMTGSRIFQGNNDELLWSLTILFVFHRALINLNASCAMSTPISKTGAISKRGTALVKYLVSIMKHGEDVEILYLGKQCWTQASYRHTNQCQGDVPHSELLFCTVLNKNTRASGHKSLLQKKESTATDIEMHGTAVIRPVEIKRKNVTFLLINIKTTNGAANTNVSLRKMTALAVNNAIAYR